jgi:Mg-chelatase subunit ChlD
MPTDAPVAASAPSDGAELNAEDPTAPDQTVWRDTEHPAGEAPRIDIAFVIDSTSSMQPVIDAAKSKIRGIAGWIRGGDPQPCVRFAIVAYRDLGDEYVTRLYGFTPDVGQVEKALNQTTAEGGGDEPEHVVQGLRRAVSELAWDESAKLKILFLLGDAPPHLDYGEPSDVEPTLLAAKNKGIVMGTICCGDSMTPEGVAFWQRLAEQTGGPYERIASTTEVTLESAVLEAIRLQARDKGISY